MAIIERLRRVSTRFKLPKILVVDNGTQLHSKQLKDFLASLKIKHRPVPLYAPMQNGLIERFNRIIAEKLQEPKNFGWKIEEALQETLFHYRCTLHSTTRVSSYEALFGRRMRNMLTNLYPDLSKVPATHIDREPFKRKRNQMKRNADTKRAAKSHRIKEGDWLRVKTLDGTYSEPKHVVKIGKTSVTFVGGKVADK